MTVNRLSNSFPCVEACQRQESEEAFSSARSIQLGSVGLLALAGLLSSSGEAQAAVQSGARCQAVDQLQMALAKRGYAVGAVDGVFGRKTERAVRQFQQSQQLVVDGIVGPMTAKAMGLSPEFSCGVAVASEARHAQGGHGVEFSTVDSDGSSVAATSFSSRAYLVATHGSELRLRRAPAGEIIGALKPRSRVTVVGASQGWAKLSSGAWVSQTWLAPVSSDVKPAGTHSGGSVELPASQSTGVNGPAVQAAQAVVEDEAGMIQEIASVRPGDAPSDNASSEVLVEDVFKSRAVEVGTSPGEQLVTAASSSATPTAETVQGTSERSVSLTASHRWRPATYDVIVMPKPEFAVPASTGAGAVSTEVTSPEVTRVSSGAIAVTPPEGAVALADSSPTSSKLLPESESPLQEPVVEDEAVALSTLGSMQVVTHGDRLLIRAEPKGEIIGSVANGIQLNIIREQDGWYELETGGWVLGRWLRDEMGRSAES